MENEITLQVECEGDYLSPVPGTDLQPPEPASIEKFRVYLTKKRIVKGEPVESRLDITEFLTEHDERTLYNEYLDACEESE